MKGYIAFTLIGWAILILAGFMHPPLAWAAVLFFVLAFICVFWGRDWR